MSLTVGVEEEFLLVDRTSGRPAPVARTVLAKARRTAPSAPDVALHSELATTQVEAASGVCTDLSELGRQLLAERRRLAAAAAAVDTRLVPTGTPVVPGPPPPRSSEGRFARVHELYRDVVADYQVCGCHVHVGVPDRQVAVAVVNQLRPWLPTLLAISVNSPFDRGRDTGFGSWRMVTQSRFPGSGLPPLFATVTAYDRAVARLVDAGVIVDPAMTFWLARPSPRFPTVEVRVADVAASVEEATLQAALTRALVATALSDLAHGRPAARIDEQVGAAALWSAARYGLAGPAVDPVTGARRPASELLAELVRHVSPALSELGDLTTVQRLLAALARHGTGAERQRHAARFGLTAVLDHLTAEATSATFTEAN
jgi:carboxylate-amine ligase